MMFIELNNTIINTNEIVSIEKRFSPYDSNKIFGVDITLSSGKIVSFDKEYYEKLSNLLKPIVLKNDNKEGFCQ